MKNLAVLLLGIVVISSVVTAEVPQTINYQGRLTDSDGVPADGNFQIQFSIYDVPSEGTALWSSGFQTVSVQEGLFDYQLGAHVPLPHDIMTDTLRWLGIKVGADPEIDPRTKITSTAFAYHALRCDSAGWAQQTLEVAGDPYVNETGDEMSGGLVFDGDGGGGDGMIQVGATFSNLFLYNGGFNSAMLWGGSFAMLQLHDDDHDLTAELSANSGTAGGWLRLQDAGGDQRVLFRGKSAGGYGVLYDGSANLAIAFDAANSGPASVTLPEGAIHSDDIFNEPGIASNLSTEVVTLVPDSMRDLLTVTITTPDDGYIVVEGKCSGRCSGTLSYNYGYVQIDETSGGGAHLQYYAIFGASGFASSVSNWYPVYVTRVYEKPAGTYTFRLEGKSYSGAGPGAVTHAQYPILTAVYYPMSYGTVIAAVSATEAAQFDEVTPLVPADDRPHGTPASVPAYKVDLRELELKAARLRAAAERAQRELMEERIRQAEQEMNSLRQGESTEMP